MKKLFLTLLATLFVLQCNYAQTSKEPNRNFSYLEAGGSGLFYSINYERQLSKNPGLSWRVGLGGYHEVDFYITYSTGLAYLFSLNQEGSSFLEVGLNFTLAREYMGLTEDSNLADTFENIVPAISYRKHFENDIFFRAGLNAVINPFGFTPWCSIAVGKSF